MASTRPQSATASIAPERRTELTSCARAVAAIASHRRELLAVATERRRRGYEVRDQTFRVETFALRPAAATRRPLVLVGGMGPVAGADGFERACRRFGETREIVLLQACAVPDRTRAIVAGEHEALVSALVDAVRAALETVTSPHGPVDVLVLCNAAHAVLPTVMRRVARTKEIHWTSLVECTAAALSRRGRGPTVLLASTGTRVGRVYSHRFDVDGIEYREPSDALQHQLMRAIYDGVKALDGETALDAGARVFADVLDEHPEASRIVAACTEISEILAGLRRKGSDALRDRLSKAVVIDPVELAFDALRS